MPDDVLVAVGLGSNLEDPQRQLQRALMALAGLPATRLLAVSPLYRSPALLPARDAAPQPDYCNAVALLYTRLEPLPLLQALQGIEARQGRERRQRWAARTLDLDLLLYGELSLELPGLQLPHPRLHERNFVLQPLSDLMPDLPVPGRGRVAELATALGGNRLRCWSEP